MNIIDAHSTELKIQTFFCTDDEENYDGCDAVAIASSAFNLGRQASNHFVEIETKDSGVAYITTLSEREFHETLFRIYKSNEEFATNIDNGRIE